LLPASGLLAQTASRTARSKVGRIDTHHHANPPIYVKTTGQFANWTWTPAASIEQMDNRGALILSFSNNVHRNLLKCCLIPCVRPFAGKTR